MTYHAVVVLVEAPTLRAAVGAAYHDYRQWVPRWLPSLPGHR